MSDSSLAPARYYLRESVQKTERPIRRKGGVVSSRKVIAEQVFGFGTSLFETHHYRLIGGVVMHCFPHKPPTSTRSQLSVKLNRIREFRNWVYHKEPICFDTTIIDFSPAFAIRQDIYDLLQWIDSDLVACVEYFDVINSKANSVSGF